MSVRRKRRIIRLVLICGAVLALLGGLLAFTMQQHDSDALWKIVQRCSTSVGHRPCVLYKPEEGYALLKDSHGRGQYLVVPTVPVRGIEEERLLKADTPNYLGRAWQYRAYVGWGYGATLPDEALSLAINPRTGRSQEHLHIHLECIRPDVHSILETLPMQSNGGDVTIDGHLFHWLVLHSLEPSPLWAHSAVLFGDESETRRGTHGIVVTFVKGRFILLESTAHGLYRGSAEDLQSHVCEGWLPHKAATTLIQEKAELQR